ncbi:carbohydrate ABC transporter permease [Fimbriimonas ginsengisoli]|uniref:Sugar ABC transporter, permease protein n=1 Tax=Fimbriimonas ginsengisoli Gsoil 348 TaxID=661478 RepID=A0A068NLZ6_FIMGI|nr:sugar ABC transporter permease [Fimbriimonas ginsengisoli]AIE84543.1 sugar ABC transporter, permease protein [Fimbriimonas ginsengisoli Gsoil 348]
MATFSSRKSKFLGWLFVGPAFAHLLVFALIPMGYALYLSFFKIHLVRDERQFVGLFNYRYTFGDAPFWNAMWNSARYALMSVPLGMAVGLGVALLVNQKLRGITIFRTLYYIPSIVSPIALAMLWIYVYLPNTGMVNTVLGWLGITTKTDFLNDIQWAMWALVVMSALNGIGPKMILFLAGLLNIPPELYEAASLDGATRARTFWRITLPMLAPTTFFVMVTSTIGAMQVFAPIYLMTKGGPEESTDVVGYHIFQEAWVRFNTGLSAAQSFILLAAIVAIAVFQFRLQKGQLQGYSTI